MELFLSQTQHPNIPAKSGAHLWDSAGKHTPFWGQAKQMSAPQFSCESKSGHLEYLP